MSTVTAPRQRKPRGPSKLKPRHYDYLRLRQAGKSQKEAIQLTGLPQKTAYRAEQHPDGKKFLAEVAENARIAGQYGVKEAVQEVDKAIGFAYEQENPNAIAKLLEHKSKLYGLLIERMEVKATYVDLKGALEQAKERVLKQLNTGDRGLSVPSLLPPALETALNHSPVQPTTTDPQQFSSDQSTSMDKPVEDKSLHDMDASITPSTQA